MRAPIFVALAVLIGVAALGSPASPSASYGATDSGVSEPITGGVHGRPFMPSYVEPEAYGYTEAEYLLGGTARTYAANRQPVRFTTRILVLRPRVEITTSTHRGYAPSLHERFIFEIGVVTMSLVGIASTDTKGRDAV